MSTRGAYGFRHNGTDYLRYNHSDSYPDWLGNNVIEYICSLGSKGPWLAEVRKGVEQLIKVECEEDTVTDEHKAIFEGLSMEVRNKASYYTVLRSTQGKPGEMLRARFYEDYRDFLFQSLFCRWAYVINLDTERLEVYAGSQPEGTGPNHGRYRDEWAVRPRGRGGYGAVKLVCDIPFAEIRQSDSAKLIERMNAGVPADA